MSKLQRKATQDATTAQETSANASRPTKAVSVAGDTHAEVASPARDLMAHLNFELSGDISGDLSADIAQVDKYPLKWTILGLGLFCGLCWYGLLSLIF